MLVRVVQDRPGRVTLALGLLVAAHGVASVRWNWLSPYKALSTEALTDNAITIYAGTAGAAALVAGFAGVVLVFTIGAQSPRLRLFRSRGGASLRRNWIIVIAEPFAATFLGIIAAITQTTAGRSVAPWLFELGVVLLAHGAGRLLWLLWELVEIVAADDVVQRQEQTVPLSRIFGADAPGAQIDP